MTEEEADNLVLDKIDDWHNGDSKLPIHDYLGVGRDAYRAYAEGRAMLLLPAESTPKTREISVPLREG
jgi:predicted protein tyrosine phosphatase